MKKIHIIFYILSLLLLFTAVCGTVKKSHGENIITKDTVLLNPKYASLIDSLVISSENKKIELFLTDKGTIGIYNDLVFPVNTSKLLEIITLASTTTTAQIIDTISNDSRLSSFVDGITVDFKDSLNNTCYSSIIFGANDFSGSNRYIKSAKNDTIFLINDDFYSFLQVDPRAWLDSKIFPSIILSETPISITFKSIDSFLVFSRADAIFTELLANLLSLQSTNIVSVAEYEKKSPLHEIVFNLSNGVDEKVAIYQLVNTYVVIPQNEQLYYGLEISQWTYDKLITAVQK